VDTQAETDAVAPRAVGPRPSRPPLALDLSLLAVVGVLLFAALAAGGAILYQQLYSPTAFVLRYLDLLAQGRAADALALPGVTVDSAELESAGLSETASGALLRSAVLAQLTDVTAVSEVVEGDIVHVTVSYLAGGLPGTTTFEVARLGTIGVAPTWRFDTSPLAVVDLRVRGSLTFDVNGFTIDRRQVAPETLDADPMAPIPLLVFSPGAYSFSIDTSVASTPGVLVLSDSPLTGIPVELRAEPTDEFVAVVQERVEEFLTACAQQEVLQPTGCPFGYHLEDRIDSAPQWSIVEFPTIELVPEGADWRIPPSEATAHLEVDVRSLFDGSLSRLDEDVPFTVTGTIDVQSGGSVTITLGGTDTQ
jgi:hypothetical protein